MITVIDNYFVYQNATPEAESKQESIYIWDAFAALFTPNTNMFVSIIIAVLRVSQQVCNVGHVFP
jgi:hypothetical protein